MNSYLKILVFHHSSSCLECPRRAADEGGDTDWSECSQFACSGLSKMCVLFIYQYIIFLTYKIFCMFREPYIRYASVFFVSLLCVHVCCPTAVTLRKEQWDAFVCVFVSVLRAVERINAAIRKGVAEETVNELMNPDAKLPQVYPSAADLYQRELSSLQQQSAEVKTHSLPHNICSL